jgi:hypothetical protein
MIIVHMLATLPTFYAHKYIDVETYNSSWKIHISLDERNYFSPTLWRSYHEHILGITKNGVIEKNAEEHQCKRN